MATKFEVEISVYIPKRGFAIGVCAKFDFLRYISKPVILHLQNGAQCLGVLAGYDFSTPTRIEGEQKWGLFVKSSEIQNPEEIVIVGIEISDLE
jgi:hypothetical protein